MSADEPIDLGEHWKMWNVVPGCPLCLEVIEEEDDYRLAKTAGAVFLVHASCLKELNEGN